MRRSRLQRGNAALRMIVGIALFALSIGMQFVPPVMEAQKALSENQLGKLFDLNIPVIVGTVGLIFLLWSVVESFYTGPLWKIINERNNSLEQTFTEAENLRSEMAQMKSDYEKRLVAAEATAREQIQAQMAEVQDLKKSLMIDAQAKADEMVARATKDIEAERSRALADIRVHVTQLTLGATEKLLNANVDNDRNRALINEFIDRVEVKN